MSVLQRFKDLNFSHTRPGATKICLYHGRAGHGEEHLSRLTPAERGRMGFLDWHIGCPVVMAQLFPVPAGVVRLRGPNATGPKPKSFAVCPELENSYISKALATHFGFREAKRHITSPEIVPLLDLLGVKRPIPWYAYVSASVELEASISVFPPPLPADKEFKFRIVKTPDDLAILGRNVIDRMLLLYRGGYVLNRHRLNPRDSMAIAANSPARGRFYYGYDSGE